MLTYAIQHVGDNLPLEPQGATDFLAFRQAIDAFPWAAEHAKWDELQEGPFPALVLQNTAEQRELWVTALGADVRVDFELQSVSMRLSKSFFGKPKMKQGLVGGQRIRPRGGRSHVRAVLRRAVRGAGPRGRAAGVTCQRGLSVLRCAGQQGPSANVKASRLCRSSSGPRSTVANCPLRTTTRPLTTV